MKRIVFASIALLALTSLFSAKIEHEALPSAGLSETITIILDFESISPIAFPGIEIGFSSNEITDIDDEVEVINGQRFSLTFDDSSAHATALDDIYVFWKIKRNTKLRAALSIEEPLKNSRGDSLDWSAGVADSTYKVGKDSYYTGSLSFIPSEQLRADGPIAGSRKLEIITEELNTGNVVPGEYIGELKLNIAIN